MNTVIELPIHELFKDLRNAIGTCFVCGKPYHIELRDALNDNVALYVWCSHHGTAAASVDGSTCINAECVLVLTEECSCSLKFTTERIKYMLSRECARWHRKQDELARDRGNSRIEYEVSK